MQLDYTWVSASQPINDPNDLIRARGPQARDQFSVVQIQPTPGEVADLEKDSRTLALTPTMPVSLIKPVTASAEDESTHRGPAATRLREDKVAWGVQAVQAHESRFTGRGAVVAVLDTGLAGNHPAFADMQVTVENFTQDESAVDANGHGTHCAGTVAGGTVDGLRIGVAPDIDSLLIGKVLADDGQGSTTAIVKGVQWASMQGAHVISMSLGIDFPAYVEILHKRQGLELKAAVSLALQAYASNVDMFAKLGDSLSALSYIGQGSLLVAAAGNESRRPEYTIGTSPPAVAPSIMSVAAVDEQIEAAVFSNTHADISAPGVQITSAGIDGRLATLSGTSMATPHVVGVAALWVQRFLEADQTPGVEQLRAALFSKVRLPDSDRKSDYADIGRGLVLAPER